MNIGGHTDGAKLTEAELAKVEIPIYLLEWAEEEEMIAQKKNKMGWDDWRIQLCW